MPTRTASPGRRTLRGGSRACSSQPATSNTTTDDAHRSELLKEAQTIIADDYVNGYLFQLAKTGVADARIEGLWENSPTPANDLSKVHWTE